MIWHKYPTVEVVQEYMNYLTRNYPSLCKQEVIGKSDENNAIKVRYTMTMNDVMMMTACSP